MVQQFPLNERSLFKDHGGDDSGEADDCVDDIQDNCTV